MALIDSTRVHDTIASVLAKDGRPITVVSYDAGDIERTYHLAGHPGVVPPGSATSPR